MAHSAHEKRVELVTLVVEGNFTSILEFHSFVTIHVEGGRVKPGLGGKTIPTIHTIEVSRAFDKERSNWGSMLSLL